MDEEELQLGPDWMVEEESPWVEIALAAAGGFFGACLMLFLLVNVF